MNSVTVKAGQSLVDIAIQYLGSSEAVYQLAQLNELSITDELSAGQELKLSDANDERIIRVFKEQNLNPAANLDLSEQEPQGIDFWIIEQNFIVQ